MCPCETNPRRRRNRLEAPRPPASPPRPPPVPPRPRPPAGTSCRIRSTSSRVSAPYGIATSDEPNISSTRWRTAVDHKALRYFFESALSPNTFWVDLEHLDFTAGAPVLTLHLGEGEKAIYAGDASAHFEKSTPFTFLPVP